MKKQGQVAIEFLLLIAFSVILLLFLITTLSKISSLKTDEKTYYELNDLGRSIQQELLLTTELEDGYIRKINLPETVNGRNYELATNTLSNYVSYMNITFNDELIYYQIPPINGTFSKGDNIISKINNTIFVY